MRGDCTGSIGYRSANGDIGREAFSIRRQAGGRIVRAHCEIDGKQLIRDASWSLDGDWRPIEGYVRLTQGGVFVGSAVFSFGDHAVDCLSATAEGSRCAQHLAGRPAYLGLHPLIGDGLLAAARGIDAVGVERILDCVTCSYAPDGDTAPAGLPIAIAVTYVGDESIEVPAGRFAAHRFAVSWQPHWAAADLWVVPEDYILLRLDWSEAPVRYELDELSWTGQG